MTARRSLEHAAKRAARRQRQKEANERGAVSTPRVGGGSTHATSGKAEKKRREGERLMGDSDDGR